MGEGSQRKRSFGAFATMLVMWIFGATDGLADPFGDPVKYPRIPALIIAEVQIDGKQASMHDTVAAFVGGELRGKAKVIYSKGKVYVALMVNVDGATNTVTFKIYDASADAELTATLGGASTVLIVPAGTIGSGDSPVTISTSVADDGGGTPVDGGSLFGSPVQHPQIPAVVIAKVYVEGQPASEGDHVGVYVGDELRGNGVVVKSDGLAYSAITVNVSSSSEIAEFKIWDKSATKTYSAKRTDSDGFRYRIKLESMS